MELGRPLANILAYSLAGVFGLSALAKAKSLDSTRRQLVQYGIPDQHALRVVNGLICSEATIALTLAIRRTRRIGGVFGASSLAVFSVTMVNHLVHGRAPECGCFGAASSHTVSWKMVARNSGLMAAAVLVVVDGEKEAQPMRSSAALLNFCRKYGLHLAIAIEGLVLTRLLYQFGSIARGLEGSRVNTHSLKKGALLRGDGNEIVAEIVSRASGSAALFVHSQCKHCARLMPVLQTKSSLAIPNLVLVYQGTELELESAGLGDLRDEVILDLDGAATSQIGVQFTPALLQLDEEGRLCDEPVFGTEGVISQLEADERVD